MIGSLGWKTIRELADEESRSVVYKSLNGLAPQYMRNLFTRDSTSNSRSLQNTAADLRLLKKTSANGQKCFLFAKLRFGIASQLRPNRHPLLTFLNIVYDGLGVFWRPGGWRARSSCAWCQLGREQRFVFEFSLSGRQAYLNYLLVK